jgi:alpha-L-rhamnosidase
MKIKSYIFFLSLYFCVVTASSQKNASLTVDILKCDSRQNPLGIDDSSPDFSWTFLTKERNQYQAAYRILVSSSRKNLTSDLGDIWDSGKTEDSNNIHVPYKGIQLISLTRYFWKVKIWNTGGMATPWSNIAYFETAFLGDSTWKSSWICSGRKQQEKDEDFYLDNPAPQFWKTFTIAKPIKSARLYISGLGYYEASLNGKKIGDNILDPGWTNYAKTVLYSTFDISSQIHKGKNIINVLLGNGWYNPLPLRLFGSFNLRKELTVGQPKLIAYLLIHYLDGSSSSITTDSSWLTGESYILQNSIYLGEKQDARIKVATGTAARISDPPGGKLTAQIAPPIRITKLIPSIRLSEPKKNVWVFDMGENFAGLIRMRVHGSSGQTIHFRYGELLFPDGHVNGLTTVAGHIKEMWNMNGGPGSPKTAFQEDSYICNGNGAETFQPHFTFHGFRYIEISGLTTKPSLSDLEGLRMNSDVAENGKFYCSNPLFNEIQQNTLHSFLSNIFSVQSDCPGRERQGYGADMVVSAEAFMFNYDMSCFYSKTVHDFKVDVRPNGGMPECAPYNGIVSEGFDGGAGPIEWQLAFSFLQKKLFQFYGNRKIIEDNYEQTKIMVEFLRSQSKDFLIDHGIGDHVSVAPKHIPLTSGTFYYQHVKILALFAKILNKTSEAEQYNTLADSILNSFNRRYLNSGTGLYDTSSNQITQIFPLWNEMVPLQEKKNSLEALWNDIEIKNGGHISTGIFGTKMLFDLCRQYNRNDIAQITLNKTDYPGYGYMIKNGATSLWETWEKPDQNSWNHPMFGSVSEWFYRSLLGINPAEDAFGYDKIVLKPFTEKSDQFGLPKGSMDFAHGYYSSIRGNIVSSWKRKGGILQWHIEIPVNTRARVYIPCKPSEEILEQNRNILKCPNLHFQGTEQDYSIFDADAGNYDFTVQAAGSHSSKP